MFHVKPPPSDAASFAQATGATVAQMAGLNAFRTRLMVESAAFNLVGPSALADFWPRHAYDSAQLLRLAPTALRWADLGAGAGFPGLVLAILLKGTEEAHVHLVESQQKRARFLQTIVDDLALPASVHCIRAESFRPAPACDVVTARACAPLVRLIGFALPFFRAGASGLFLKGRAAADELAEARRVWRMEADLLPSLSDPDARIVRVTHLVGRRAAHHGRATANA